MRRTSRQGGKRCIGSHGRTCCPWEVSRSRGDIYLFSRMCTDIDLTCHLVQTVPEPKKSQLSVGSQRATGAGSEDQLVQPAPLVTSGEVAGDRRFTGRHDRAGFPAPTAPTSRYVAEKLSEFALMPRASPRVTHLADEAHLFHPLASAALGVYFGAGGETETRGQPCSATRAAAVTPCRGLPAMGQPPAALPAPRQPALGKGGRWSGSPHMPPAPEGWTLERGQVWVPAC